MIKVEFCFSSSKDWYVNDKAKEFVELYEDETFNDESDLYDRLWDFIDNDMMYYDDQWALLKEYFTPDDIPVDALMIAFESLQSDIMCCLSTEEVDEDEDEDDDEEEEDEDEEEEDEDDETPELD